MSLVEQLVEDIHSISSMNIILGLIDKLPYQDRNRIEELTDALTDREKEFALMEVEEAAKLLKGGDEILSKEELKMGEEVIVAYSLDWTNRLYTICPAIVGQVGNCIEIYTRKGNSPPKLLNSRYLRFIEHLPRIELFETKNGFNVDSNKYYPRYAKLYYFKPVIKQ